MEARLVGTLPLSSRPLTLRSGILARVTPPIDSDMLSVPPRARPGAAGLNWPGPAPADPHRRLRAILVAVLILGIVGSAVELVLLEHMEDVWQLVPLCALGAGLVSAMAAAVRPGRLTLRVHQIVMAAFIVSGAMGVYLHYRGNVEFELEMSPSMRGLELFWKSLKGATPALAPGVMAQLGLLGLAYTYRHPGLRALARERTEEGS